MQNTFTPDKLTAAQISALRQANSVCFRWKKETCQIEAQKDKGKPTASNPFPQDVLICINAGNSLTNYRKVSNEAIQQKAFAMVHSAQFCETWQTIASLLKVGDELTLKWIAGNNTENMENAGFNADELKLVVQRGTKRLVFSVLYQVNAAGGSLMING